MYIEKQRTKWKLWGWCYWSITSSPKHYYLRNIKLFRPEVYAYYLQDKTIPLTYLSFAIVWFRRFFFDLSNNPHSVVDVVDGVILILPPITRFVHHLVLNYDCFPPSVVLEGVHKPDGWQQIQLSTRGDLYAIYDCLSCYHVNQKLFSLGVSKFTTQSKAVFAPIFDSNRVFIEAKTSEFPIAVHT